MTDGFEPGTAALKSRSDRKAHLVTPTFVRAIAGRGDLAVSAATHER